MVIHASADVRQRAAEMRADDLELRMLVEQTAGDDAGHGDGVLEHVAECAGEFVALHLFGGHGLGRVQQQRHTEFLGTGVEPVELRFVAPRAREVGVKQNAHEPELLHATIEFSCGGGLVL